VSTSLTVSQIQEKFPFLTLLKHQDHEFVGIVQNSDDKVLTFYDFDSLRTAEEKKLFLELGDIWWWESNRILPINIFIGKQMKLFQYSLKTVIVKDVEIVFGPVTSLNNIMKKRIKKRQIQLVRKV